MSVILPLPCNKQLLEPLYSAIVQFSALNIWVHQHFILTAYIELRAMNYLAPSGDMTFNYIICMHGDKDGKIRPLIDKTYGT